MIVPLLCLLISCAQAAHPPREELVIGLPDPIRARGLLAWNEQHEVDGFARRLMDEVAAELGLALRYVPVRSGDLLEELLAGEVDAVGPLSVLPERLERVVFSTPVLIAEGAVFVRAGSPAPLTLDALRTRRVGVAGSGVGHQFCVTHGIPCEPGPELRTALRRLEHGELDCVVTTRIAGRYDIELFDLHGLSDAPLEFEGLKHAFAFAMRREDKDRLARLNYGLALVRDGGAWDELYDRWVAPLQPRPRPRSPMPWLVGGLLALVGGSAFVALRMRTRLSHRTRELDESEQCYRAVAESLPALVYSYFVGTDGRRERRFATSNVAEWRARFPELEPGADYRTWLVAVHPDDRASYEAATLRSRTAGTRFDTVFRLRAQDGRFHHLHSIATPLAVEGGTLWQSLLLDVTPLHEAREQRHQLELELLQAQKLEGLGLLAGGIAHDFNNLLAGIQGNLELAAFESASEGRTRRLEEARQGTRRAAELTNQLLAYAGRARLEETVVALDGIVREMVDLLGSSLRARAALELDTVAARVRGDSTLLRQVVMNLLTNAIEAIPEGRTGQVCVRVARRTLEAEEAASQGLAAGTHVELLVRDDGVGMDAATRARIFDPFFTTKFAGRGLGLSVLQRTVERHGGAWQVESVPGEGTSFRILLPEAVEAPEELREATLVPVPRRLARILVVDDDPRVGEVAAALLAACGHLTQCATDEAEALETLARFRPDAVLLDLTMPGRGGLELAPLLRHAAPHLAIVLMSGYSERDLARSAAEFEGYLAKPFTGSELARALESALERAPRERKERAESPASAGKSCAGPGRDQRPVIAVLDPARRDSP